MHYDYSSEGLYFVTICAKDRRNLFSRISVGAAIGRPPKTELTACGRAVQSAVESIPMHYENTSIDHYVIMPNHIHFIIKIGNTGQPTAAPTLSRIVNQFKGYVTKQTGNSIWQKGFYDHVIRDEDDYLTKANYIENNPAKWAEDELYTEDL